LKKSLLILLVLTSAIYLAGCATFETRTKGNPIENDKLDSIRPGTTTRAQIVNIFGIPAEETSEGGVEKMVYTYKERKVPVYLGLIKNETRARVTVTTLEITLKGDTVSSYKFSSSSEE
jgi:outer membrane protein assembly factor BamE (lipoprotein component of BamABCDE complex)